MASARVIAHQRTTPSDGIGARDSRQARVRMAIAGTGIYLFVYLWRAGCRGMSSGDGVVASIIDMDYHRGAKREYMFMRAARHTYFASRAVALARAAPRDAADEGCTASNGLRNR